jgi:hypothetical protein
MVMVRKFPLVVVARHLKVPDRTLSRWVKERRHLFPSEAETAGASRE